MKLSARKASREKRILLQMTSMIDVVFLLLIFFIVSASFVETERELASAIQIEGGGTVEDLEPVVVNIVQEGGGYVYRVGGLDIAYDPANSEASAQKLFDLLERQPGQSKFDGAFVRVASGAPFDMAATAIAKCKEAKFISVSYIPAE
jgi:biopolymer transport protein ExbD